MSVLMRPSRPLLIAAAMIALAGCDRGSPAYRHIKDLPDSEWESYASTLPMEERLNLHKEIMERSGHNPIMTIRFAFSSQPAEAYRSIVQRLKSGDNSRYYSSVIYAIDGSRGFKVCSQADRKIVQDYLAGITGYPGQKEAQPDFYTC
ncbi:hypothetical protein [Sphingobium yanoikuyae]|uniref:hypothetical protein n=1 Tax=Sphingobium yanoikuyae TaxID=13690 RepID=UPI00111321BF|nr:hypothetical protein [Sphingobium yanoikuyae]